MDANDRELLDALAELGAQDMPDGEPNPEKCERLLKLLDARYQQKQEECPMVTGPRIQKLREETAKLSALLQTPEPGLISWVGFVSDQVEKVRAAWDD